MERIGVQELDQEITSVLSRVKRGSVVEVVERGAPVARLVPVGRTGSMTVDRLLAEGRITPAVVDGPIPLPPVHGDPARDVAAELEASRANERW